MTEGKYFPFEQLEVYGLAVAFATQENHMNLRTLAHELTAKLMSLIKKITPQSG